MCGKNDLGNVGLEFSPRTEQKMEEVYEAMERLPKGEAIELSKCWSLHPVQVSMHLCDYL